MFGMLFGVPFSVNVRDLLKLLDHKKNYNAETSLPLLRASSFHIFQAPLLVASFCKLMLV